MRITSAFTDWRGALRQTPTMLSIWCAERGFLEFHHVDPYALGASTIENITLRCRAHNLYEAEQEFRLPLSRDVQRRRPTHVREHPATYRPRHRLDSVRNESVDAY